MSLLNCRLNLCSVTMQPECWIQQTQLLDGGKP